MKLTQQIKRGLKEFTRETCLEVVRQSEIDGNGGNTIGYNLLDDTTNMTENLITYSGDRMIATGCYIREHNL